VINPPAKNKRNYWTSSSDGSDRPDADPDRWFEAAERIPGSWWPAWFDWLAPQSGDQVAARGELGNAEFSPIEDAPGSYVKQPAP
jgi:polyhydroxyalkanoate synthase